MYVLLQIQEDILCFRKIQEPDDLSLPLREDVSDTRKGINGICIELKDGLDIVINSFGSK